MDDLFRMLVLRAPQSADSLVNVQLPLGEPTEFQRELAKLRGGVRAVIAPPSAPAQPAVPAGLVATTTRLSAPAQPAAPAGLVATTAQLSAPAQPAVSAGLVATTTRLSAPNPAASATVHPQYAMWNLAAAFARSPAFLADPAGLALAAPLAAFYADLTALADPATLAELEHAVAQAFGVSSAALVVEPKFADAEARLGDALVAAKLSPVARLADPDAYVLLLRLLAIAGRIAAHDQTLTVPGAVKSALGAHILLPPSIFPVDPAMIQPMCVADDWVVREHISRYELGEIAQLENILQGELRKKTSGHTLSTQQTLVVETTTTTETTKDLQTTDRFDLKTEVDNTLKEDLGVKAGASVKYTSPTVTASANVDVSYSKSKTDSEKVASDQSRDVVQRATTKVTAQVRQQQTTTIIETFSDTEEHSFDNSQGTKNIAGVYQWVNKVLRVQLFDLGPRMIFDVMVPEPAALLWDLKSQPDTTAPVPPVAFTAEPGALNSGTIGGYLTAYGVTGVPAPPADHVTVSASYDAARKSDDDYNKGMVQGAVLSIPEGYQAQNAAISVVFAFEDSDKQTTSVGVEIGGNDLRFTDQSSSVQSVNLSSEEGSLAVAMETLHVDSFACSIDVRCTLTPQALFAWQLAAHDAITTAYLQRVKDYQDKLAAQQLQAASSDQVAGTNPDANAAVIRTELKRQAIALIAGPTYNMLGFDAVLENALPPLDPRPDPDSAMIVGRVARFFEEALEWENLNYIFYPYYWGRSKNWYQRVLAQDPDPQFVEFLRAGQARVVVPVREGFQSDISDFVYSGGQIWRGAPLPSVHSSDYLPIATEIEAAQNPDLGTPGTWWETTLPTNQLYLRADSCLPTWKVDDKWHWTPDYTPCQQKPAAGE